MDALDKKILHLLQTKATLPLSEISRRVGISKTPCWNRIRAMEESGVIKERITVLDREKIGLPLVYFYLFFDTVANGLKISYIRLYDQIMH